MPLRRLAKWLRWSNTPQAWRERLGLFGTVIAALALWWMADSAPLWLQALSWAALALMLAFFSRRGWVKFFGPVLFYDLVRNARRTRFFAYRMTYLCVLFFLLCWIYLRWKGHYVLAEAITSREAAELSLLFFNTFMAVQLLFVVVLTPAFTASAVAEEKERKTIEFILATDLRNREIVFGKLLSRLASLSTFILAGLPVMSALQFMGGFSPRALAAGFAATMLTMISLASLTLLASALCRRTREALFLVYLIMIGYVGLTMLAHYLLNYGAYNSFPSTSAWESPLTLEDVLLGVRAGNPIFAMQTVMPRGNFNENVMVRALGNYAIFHGLLTLFCIVASIVLLRRACLKEPPVSRSPAKKRRNWRPALGNWPMIWKEVWLEHLVKRRWLVRGGMLLLVFLSFVPVASMVTDYYHTRQRLQSQGISPRYQPGWRGYYADPWNELGEETNRWVRIVGMPVALLGLAGVAVRAATSVRSEHDKDTMTSLLLTPLSSEEILFGKWLGSIASMRWFAVWLALIWLVAVICNGLTPLAVPLLAVACLFYAAAAASLGLYCSVVCKTSLRAILSTLILGLFLFAGHWIPWMCCIPIIDRPGDSFKFIFQMQGSITPPVVLAGYLPVSPDALGSPPGDVLWHPLWVMFIGISGSATWGLLAWFVWVGANYRFKKEGGRLDSDTPPTNDLEDYVHDALNGRVRSLHRKQLTPPNQP
jgi:ABC-type transport system involved in multi-copper enzyme maturation permease subunit